MRGLLFLAPLPLLPMHVQTPPPPTRTETVVDTIHGVNIADPYRWLENQESPETRKWLDSQIQYTRSFLDRAPGRDKIAKRVAELMRVDAQSPIARRGGRIFHWKRAAWQNQPVLYMDGRILIDVNTLSKDGETSVQLLDISEDGELLAYGLQEGGEDELTVRILNVNTMQHLPFTLPKTRYWAFELTPDKSAAYYVRFDDEGPRLLYAPLAGGTAPKVLFGDNLTQENGLGCTLSRDGRYLAIESSTGWAIVDVYVMETATGKVQPVAIGLKERFSAIPGGGTLFLFTTWKAPAGRVLATPFSNPTLENAQEIVPERKAVLESVSAVGGKLVLNYLDNASSRIRIHNPDGTLLREVKLPALGAASGFVGEWDQDDAWYGFDTYGNPFTWYSYRISTGEQSLYFKPNTPVDPAKTEVKQVWVRSKDGTQVPMFLFNKKGLNPDGKTPVLLCGYGGFNVNLTPGFSASSQVWVEMGGVYAVANLRGGGEFGEEWHQAGMFEKKQNVFDDFLAAAEWLIANGYGSRQTLAIEGGSNGGLLTGAALTQRPDLFKAVICAVPLLDMVRYHLFKVAKLWTPEYGSAEDPGQFEYLYQYSPYHRVKKGVKYPAVLFVTGDADTRVDPLHARKMTALLQANTGSNNPILLHYDVKSGHAGGKPVNKSIEETADMLAFLASQLGASLP